MNLPPFSDFQLTMTEHRIQEMFSDLKHSEVIMMQDGITPENIDALCSRLIQISVNESIKAQVHLLESYHEWLCKCLESDQV